MGPGLKIIALCLVLAGCQTFPAPPIDNPRQVWCDHNKPRRPSKAVVKAMSRPELNDLIAFNTKGAKWCGWRP